MNSSSSEAPTKTQKVIAFLGGIVTVLVVSSFFFDLSLSASPTVQTFGLESFYVQSALNLAVLFGSVVSAKIALSKLGR